MSVPILWYSLYALYAPAPATHAIRAPRLTSAPPGPSARTLGRSPILLDADAEGLALPSLPPAKCFSDAVIAGDVVIVVV